VVAIAAWTPATYGRLTLAAMATRPRCSPEGPACERAADAAQRRSDVDTSSRTTVFASISPRQAPVAVSRRSMND
jgi:hypothetical protein